MGACLSSRSNERRERDYIVEILQARHQTALSSLNPRNMGSIRTLDSNVFRGERLTLHTYNSNGSYFLEFVINNNNNNNNNDEIIGVGTNESTGNQLTGSLPLEQILLQLITSNIDRNFFFTERNQYSLNDTDISNLNRVNMKDDTDLSNIGNCGITLEPFEVGEKAIILPCSHAYKEAAILEWFKQHNTCPVCRLNISR